MCFKMKTNSTKAKLNCTVTRGVKKAYLSENGDLIFVMTDGAERNLGNVKNVLPVHFTKGEDGSYTADRTYEEICLAHDSGSYVFAASDIFFANLVYKNDQGVMFASVYPLMQRGAGAHEMSVHTFMVASDNTVSMGTDICYFLPEVTETNNGKMLKVVNGEWTMVDLTTEEWTFTLEDGSTVTKAVYVG